MYHCYLHFYLTGRPCRVFEIMKEMEPLAYFSHAFSQSDVPEEALAANADVIICNLQDMEVKEAVQKFVLESNRGAELIVLADTSQVPFLADYLTDIKDIWVSPMSDDEIRFRCFRWQQTYKMSKDFWQASHYLESTINNIPNMVWYKDKEGIHEKVNDSFCNTVGKTKEQVEGQGHAYIWDVEHDDPACIKSEQEVMTKKRTFVSDEIIKKGDETRVLKTYKSPLYDLDGSVMGTVGVAIDVTKERAYEQAILRKNETLEKLFTSIDCGVIHHTLDGKKILRINRAALKILGYETVDELLEDGFDMIAESVMDKEKLRDDIRTLKKEGDSVSVDYRVQHKDGEIVHVAGNVKLLMENGELIYQRFLLDCTAQKLQEKRNERHHLQLVHALSIDYSIVCFFDLDTGKGYAIQNDGNNGSAFDDIFSGELLLKESMERYIQEFVHKDDRAMLLQAFSLERLKKELAEKKIYYANYRVIEEGKTKYFQMKAVRAGVWEENNGIVLGFRSVDEETRSEMKQKILLEDALFQANKANKAKSVFLSNMSHDIRTPMNAIVGFTNLAITHIDNQDQVEGYLRKIMTSGNHLLSLINDILDMSHIESGKIHLEEKYCSLREILNSLRNILLADIHAKQLELHIDTVDMMHEDIYCDKLRLNQVLLNLLSNSVKYTNAGGAVTMILTEKAGAPAGYANYEFCIKDNGMGMSPEFLSHIFEPFEREDNMRESGIQGTGLGMAITKNIVDMMDGTIDVKSEQGKGTEFTVCFTFRLHSGSEKPQAIEKWKDSGALVSDDDVRECLQPIISSDGTDEADTAETAMQRQTGRILLAEDIELNQEVATAILGDAGFETEIAGNGQIAVDMLKKSKPGYYQLVLMDVQMPVMNGYEATKEIRRLEDKALASIPVIAMTANAFEEDKQEALKCGMNGHIAKPIDVENLFGVLDQILAGVRS